MRLVGVGGASAVVAALLGLGSGGPARSSPTFAAGDPAQGAQVWVTAGCGACHAFAKAGSTGQTAGDAPDLDRWLVPDAARVEALRRAVRLPPHLLGRAGDVRLRRTLSAQELDDLVSFVSGRPFSAPAGPVTLVPSLPAPPPLVTAPARAVARWAKAARLPKKAKRGAAVFAKTGCLSCHTYLGNGKRRRGAPDLSRAGSKAQERRVAAALPRAAHRLREHADAHVRRPRRGPARGASPPSWRRPTGPANPERRPGRS